MSPDNKNPLSLPSFPAIPDEHILTQHFAELLKESVGLDYFRRAVRLLGSEAEGYMVLFTGAFDESLMTCGLEIIHGAGDKVAYQAHILFRPDHIEVQPQLQLLTKDKGINWDISHLLNNLQPSQLSLLLTLYQALAKATADFRKSDVLLRFGISSDLPLEARNMFSKYGFTYRSEVDHNFRMERWFAAPEEA